MSGRISLQGELRGALSNPMALKESWLSSDRGYQLLREIKTGESKEILSFSNKQDYVEAHSGLRVHASRASIRDPVAHLPGKSHTTAAEIFFRYLCMRDFPCLARVPGWCRIHFSAQADTYMHLTHF